MALTKARANLVFNGTDDTAAELFSGGQSTKIDGAVEFSNGTGSKQAEVLGVTELEPGGSAISLDLAGGQLVDSINAAQTFAAVKSLVFYAPAGNSGDVTLDTTIANGWQAALNGTVTLKPGTAIGLATEDASGYTVTAGTADLVEVSASGTDKVQVLAIGN